MQLATPRPRKPTVLFVDDESMICRAMSLLFPRHGLDIITVNTVAEACTVLREVNVDAAVIDYRLEHGECGTDVVEFIRRIRPELNSRILMISGDVSDQPYHSITEKFRLPFLPKPFDIGQVILILRQLLARDLRPAPAQGTAAAT